VQADTARYMDSFSTQGMANNRSLALFQMLQSTTLPILKTGCRRIGFCGMASAWPNRLNDVNRHRLSDEPPAECPAERVKARDQQRASHEARQVTISKNAKPIWKQWTLETAKHILDFTIESVEDFGFVFGHLRYIGSLGVSAKR